MDEITSYVANKLTHAQKRGYEPAKSSTREYHNDRRSLDLPPVRPVEQLHAAQLQLAALALERPDSQEWLCDVLAALGLRERLVASSRARALGDCGDNRGTMRGYNIHLRNYTAPCTPCADARHRELVAAMVELGVLTEKGAEKWRLQWS